MNNEVSDILHFEDSTVFSLKAAQYIMLFSSIIQAVK